uniref:Deoxyribonuclease-2-alpha n=1 Tax=Neolamprologus brichardi TaxID=32507 RepID=A0A3Q4GJU4_NEOBR
MSRFILYKAPGGKNQKIKYFYTDSKSTVSHMVPDTPGYKNLNHSEGILANTLRPIFEPLCKCSLSTGVIMVEKNNNGVWLLHSTPQFPFRRDQNKFWPDSGFKNAQTFICVTFPYTQFRNIGKHLQYTAAFPFEHDIPDDFHQELIDATKWVQAPPPSNYQMLTSREGQLFLSIAKQQLENQKDLYYTIAQLVKYDVHVQTWVDNRGREPSYCSDPLHKVYNINTIKRVLGDGSTWGPTRDHSKWCVTKSPNRPWTCIADVNRVETQYERRGGALCIVNEAVRKKFLEFAEDFEDCTMRNKKALATAHNNCTQISYENRLF